MFVREGLGDISHVGQIDDDLDHLDRTGQIDHDLDHVDPSLPLRDGGQDLYSTDPTQET